MTSKNGAGSDIAKVLQGRCNGTATGLQGGGNDTNCFDCYCHLPQKAAFGIFCFGYNLIMNTPACLLEERFHEVTDDVTYHGFNFSIAIDDIEFKVRHYDDLPGVTIVISPTAARQLPQARQLVDCLISDFRRQEVYFKDEQSDRYRRVELNTLEFVPEFELTSNFVAA
jgi:hypothetical protein